MTFENLLISVTERVATVTLNRPKVNALNRAMLGELDEAFRQLRSREDVGAVILTGAGERAFAAGADISELARLGPTEAHEHARFGQGVFARIESLGKPVIAAVNGFALGGGCELAMSATLRVAAENAEFGQPEVNLGLIPGFAGTQRLVRFVGRTRALEMVLTGDPLGSQTALSWGLVNRVVPREKLMEESLALARKVLTKAPKAVAYAIEAIDRGAEMGFEEGSGLEATLFGLCFSTEDMKEGTRAFLEKRVPAFKGK